MTCEKIRCATYSVYIRNRTTKQPIAGCDFTKQPIEGKWRRTKNTGSSPSASTADFSMPLSGLAGCCECDAEPWRDELVIERLDREGNTDGIVWVGPVSHVVDDTTFGAFTVTARDATVWPFSRTQRTRTAIKLTDVDESVVWLALWGDLTRGGQSGVTPIVTPTGNKVSVDFDRYSSVDAVITELPGISWSMSGDTLYVGGNDLGHTDNPIAFLDVDEHWDTGGAVVDKDGTYVATKVIVLDGDTILAEYPPYEHGSELGLHIGWIDADPGTTAKQATQLAYDTWQANRVTDAFLVTSAGTLSADAPVTVCDLDIGKVFTVEASSSCSTLSERMRLINVVGEFEAQETGQGVHLVEARVAIDFQPINTNRTSSSRQSI